MSLPGLLGLMALVAALLFLAAMSLDAADAQEPPPTLTVTVVEPDRREERRLVRERESFRRTTHRQARTIRRLRAAVRASVPLGATGAERGLLCIKQFEGAWGSNTGNGYYGAYQMDLAFQRAYGSTYLQAWGTANNWPPSVQTAVALAGWIHRGFTPWPTRRMCGL